MKQNDGKEKAQEKPKRQKTGGRQKGSVNKVTAMTKAVISDLLNDYHDSGLMREDFLELEPKDRLTVAEKLMNYVMPKMQSASVDVQGSHVKLSIDDKLRALSMENDK